MGQEYTYNGKIWCPQPTVLDHNSFFHAVFGQGKPRLDKDANFRKNCLLNFLKYFEVTTKPEGLKKWLERTLDTEESHEDYLKRYNDFIKKLSSDQAISAKDIPLLASLQNTVVVLFIEDNEAPEIFDPDSNFLGNYPWKIKTPMKQAVVCLRGNNYSSLRCDRYEAPTEKAEEEVEEKQDEAPSSRECYPKLQGSAGIKGSLYQINLLTIFLLKGSKDFDTFWLSTENKKAGKFDDVVFEVLPDKAFLLQAKHKLNKPITYDDLYQTNSDKDDFSLPMYYLSYQKIKRTFDVQRMTLCTNTDLRVPKEKTTELVKGCLEGTDLLYFEDVEHQCYTFNDSIIRSLTEKAKEYKERNLKGQTFDGNVFDYEGVKEFLSKFRLVICYPPKGDLNVVIEEFLRREQHCNQYQTKDCSKFINNKILEWFDYKKGIYLTQDTLRTFLCEFRSAKFCEKLQNFHMHVEGTSINYNTTKRLLRIESGRGYILNMINACCALYTAKRKCLFLNPNEDFAKQVEMVETFGKTGYETLVACFKAPKTVSVRVISDKVTGILKKNTWKKVIFFTGRTDELAELLKEKNLEEYEKVYENITFNDLSLETKNKVLQRVMLSTM